MPRISSRLLAVVCAGEWSHNLSFWLDDTSLEDVAMNMVVDTWGTGGSVN